MATATLSKTKVLSKWWEKKSPLPDAHGKVLQTIPFKLGNFDDKNRTFTAIGSTAVVDRQGEVIDQDGWDLSKFIANPVIPWAHDYYSPPVARAIEVGVVDGVLQFTCQFPKEGLYDFADTIWNLYRNQYMFAFSVGFIPKDYDWGDEPDELDPFQTQQDDETSEQNLTFRKCELLEISTVVVPANPQALVLAVKMADIDTKSAKQLMSKLQSTIKGLEEVIEISEEIENKGVISGSLPINDDKGAKWDSGAAKAAIKEWASDKDGNIDFKKYAKGFLWVDTADREKQGSYKLPIADVLDGELKVVWRAVTAVAAVLNGGRGGVDIPDDDKKDVYNQIKKYYKKFGEDAPDYSPKGLTDGNMAGDTENMDDKTKTKAGAKLSADSKDKIKAVHDYLKTMGSALDKHAKAYGVLADCMKDMSDYTDTLKSLISTTGDETTDQSDNENHQGDTGKDADLLKSEADHDGESKDVAPIKSSTDEVKKTESDDSGEVKSEDEVPSDGADQEVDDKTNDDSVDESDKTDGDESKEEEGNVEDKTEETPTDETPEDKPEESTEEELVDPENLTDEQAKAVIDAVNEELAKHTN